MDPGSTFKSLVAIAALEDGVLPTGEEIECDGYYNRELTPMTMLVYVDDMSIVRIDTGFNESDVTAIIKSKLCAE